MLETKRLILKPLTCNQLIKYIQGENLLEKELNLLPTTRTISPELKDALEKTILPNVENATKNDLYNTLWTVISKVENKMVADICILGEPNANGEIEIGYGTYDEFQRKGFMTEAVGGIIEWAKCEQRVNSIIASTEKLNVASSTVLEKNNFIKTDDTEMLYNWRLRIK